MFDLSTLEVPIVGAPMAGGPSTPELTAAVCEAGGFGMLAGTYLSLETLREQITAVRAATDRPFGVNLFVPEEIPFDEAAFAEYRDLLQLVADRVGAELPETVAYSDDHFDAKIELLLAMNVDAVSFTFDVPSRATIRRFTEAGILTIGTVTSVREAQRASGAGVLALCAQGIEAGGHRATFHIADDDPQVSTADLVAGTIEATGLPTVGAGGVGSREDVQTLLDAGAVAVQIGTLLLRCPEAGTRQAHRDALADPQFTETVTTRAFSGRLARGLLNAFIRDYSDLAPALFPQVNTLTGPIRRAGSDDPQVINLWAGTGFRNARAVPVAEVIAGLSPAPGQGPVTTSRHT